MGLDDIIRGLIAEHHGRDNIAVEQLEPDALFAVRRVKPAGLSKQVIEQLALKTALKQQLVDASPGLIRKFVQVRPEEEMLLTLELVGVWSLIDQIIDMVHSSVEGHRVSSGQIVLRADAKTKNSVGKALSWFAVFNEELVAVYGYFE